MKILLINTNPVVSRLVSLCMRDENIYFEEVSHVSQARDTAYDIVFVDDDSYTDEIVKFLGQIDPVEKRIYFAGNNNHSSVKEFFDMVVQKPFLPSQIQNIIGGKEECVAESTRERGELKKETKEKDIASSFSAFEEKKGDTIVPKSEKSDAIPMSTKALDAKAIEQIKVLLKESDEPVDEVLEEKDYEAKKVEVITKKLEDDGLEILPEEELFASLSYSAKETSLTTDTKRDNIEKKLLRALKQMKHKKIKKLLKGAEVTITIRFKDEI